MERVAIDFGTTGIRRASASTTDTGVTFERVDAPPTLAGLQAAMAPFAGAKGIEITLRCTNPACVDRSSESWNTFAMACDCRWFRILGASVEERVAPGVARQLAGELRLDHVAVLDVGASHAAVAIAGPTERAIAFDTWPIDACDMERLAERVMKRVTGVRPIMTDAPRRMVGIGGAGVSVVERIAATSDSIEQVVLDDSPLYSSIGILHANIVRVFERPLTPQADAGELKAAFLALMDNAYDAITREGYDLDDAVCVREVQMRSADGAMSSAVECGMVINAAELAQAFQRSTGSGDVVDGVMQAARVTATIEPVKPALINNIRLD
ncbi:MAG: hypothetical protein KDA33_09455 [Phycisphaerales bacterium]|nr:hypothetical protein [Phycisphaerales bacterium]